MWPCAVRALADELDLERVGGRSERACIRHDLPDGEPPVHVTAEDRFHVVERARLEDRLRALAHLLGRLEHDEDVSSGRLSREQHRGVHRLADEEDAEREVLEWKKDKN